MVKCDECNFWYNTSGNWGRCNCDSIREKMSLLSGEQKDVIFFHDYGCIFGDFSKEYIKSFELPPSRLDDLKELYEIVSAKVKKMEM